jgi:geranylgeranyl diphosphate synthase type II
MQVEDALRDQKQAVDMELDRLLGGGDSLLWQAMRHAVLSGGKRYRPLLLLSSGECLGAERAVLLPFACAVELIHCYSLVHDDLPALDNDDFRRGQPACHKVFGDDIALLAGDGLLTMAFGVMAAAPLPEALAGQRGPVMVEISRRSGAEGMIDGQVLDIRLKPEQVTEERLEEVVFKKTAGLIVASVKAGAMLGLAPAGQLQAMEEFGRNIGFAFQLRDDLLDSSPESGRKPDSRPNFVSFFGRNEARRKLGLYVEQGLEALAQAGLRSEILEHLGRRLLVPGQG